MQWTPEHNALYDTVARFVNKVANLDPVAAVAGAAIHLVNDDTRRSTISKLAEHFREFTATGLGGCALLAEPSDDLQTIALSKGRDR